MYETLIQTQVFFFISSIGFIVLWILALFFMYYLIRSMYIFSKIMQKIDKDIEQVGEISSEMISDIRDSSVFNFFFRKKKRHRKS